MKKKFSGLLLMLWLGGLAHGQAKEFWQVKDYRQWTEKECRKLLEASPWAQSRVFSEVRIDPLQDNEPAARGREPNPQIKYQAQFRSATPIRQALVRQAMLTEKYDQMTSEQKQAFDEKMQKFLTGAAPELVIVHVDYSTNVQNTDRSLAQYWQTQTTETLKNSVYLLGPKGEKVPLQRYVSATGAGRSFQFLFPRQYEGRPLLSPEDKTIKVEFMHPFSSERGTPSRVLLEFKVEKMLIQGAVVY
jgi:hypothetical protein